MNKITQNEKTTLENIILDVNTTIANTFSKHKFIDLNILKSITPILVQLYFKSLNHHPKDLFWKNRDRVYAINNFVNLVKRVVEVHSDYTPYYNLEKYLLENPFPKKENSFAIAIGDYLSQKEIEEKHNVYFYPISSEFDIFQNLHSLEYISVNKIYHIIPIIYTHKKNEFINKENKLNGKLIHLGFDTLIIDGGKIGSLCDAISLAKDLKKPTIILINTN